MVGNKSDMFVENELEDVCSEGVKFSQEINVQYFHASAKNGTNLVEILNFISKKKNLFTIFFFFLTYFFCF